MTYKNTVTLDPGTQGNTQQGGMKSVTEYTVGGTSGFFKEQQNTLYNPLPGKESGEVAMLVKEEKDAALEGVADEEDVAAGVEVLGVNKVERRRRRQRSDSRIGLLEIPGRVPHAGLELVGIRLLELVPQAAEREGIRRAFDVAVDRPQRLRIRLLRRTERVTRRHRGARGMKCRRSLSQESDRQHRNDSKDDQTTGEERGPHETP